MFESRWLVREVAMAPSSFDGAFAAAVEARLRRQVEGTCSVKHGFVICVEEVDATSLRAPLRTRQSNTQVHVRFRARLCRPTPGEVVEGPVDVCTKQGVFLAIGPLRVWISAGPKHMAPGYAFDDAAFMPTGDAAPNAPPLRVGSFARALIIGVRASRNAEDFVAVGTLNPAEGPPDTNLGPLADAIKENESAAAGEREDEPDPMDLLVDGGS